MADFRFGVLMSVTHGKKRVPNVPLLMAGNGRRLVDGLRHYRSRSSISYFTVMEFHADSFARVIAQLR